MMFRSPAPSGSHSQPPDFNQPCMELNVSNKLHRSVIFASVLCFSWGCSSSDSNSDTATGTPTSNGAANGSTGAGTTATSGAGPTGTSGGTTQGAVGPVTGGTPVTGGSPVTGSTSAGPVTGGDPVTAGPVTGGGGAGSTTTTEGGSSTTGAIVPVELPPVVTSAMGDYWNVTGTLTAATGAATVTVNDTDVKQDWDGMGAAFNEKGWAALSTDGAKAEAITLLFSAAEGANFAWGRIPIGASDYAIDRYTLADGAGGDPAPSGETNRPAADPELTSFSLDRDHELLIPYILAAKAEKPDLRFWASPWTPPVWMKTGHKTNSGEDSSQPADKPSFYDGGNMNPAHFATYAKYYEMFVDGYAAEGIDIEIVSPQNEPGYDQNYPSCLWSGTDYGTFVAQHLGPAMAERGISIMLGSLSNDLTDFTIASTALGNATAKGYFTVIGAQWNTLDKGQLDGLNSGLPYWASEHKCGNYPWEAGYQNTPPNDQAYAEESWEYIRDAIKTVGVTSYNAWNMVLAPDGLGIDTTRHWAQDSLLTAANGTVTKTPVYYVFRHISQYAQPGAKVVGTTGGDAVAFKNPDNSIVVVMHSDQANPAYVVSAGGQTVQFSMPANGWATVKIEPAG